MPPCWALPSLPPLLPGSPPQPPDQAAGPPSGRGGSPPPPPPSRALRFLDISVQGWGFRGFFPHPRPSPLCKEREGGVRWRGERKGPKGRVGGTQQEDGEGLQPEEGRHFGEQGAGGGGRR